MPTLYTSKNQTSFSWSIPLLKLFFAIQLLESPLIFWNTNYPSNNFFWNTNYPSRARAPFLTKKPSYNPFLIHSPEIFIYNNFFPISTIGRLRHQHLPLVKRANVNALLYTLSYISIPTCVLFPIQGGDGIDCFLAISQINLYFLVLLIWTFQYPKDINLEKNFPKWTFGWVSSQTSTPHVPQRSDGCTTFTSLI